MRCWQTWDVEGGELDVLRGAAKTLRRDKAIFTVELRTKLIAPEYQAAVFDRIEQLGYYPFLGASTCASTSPMHTHPGTRTPTHSHTAKKPSCCLPPSAQPRARHCPHTSHAVDEVCGFNIDCRNLLCLPRSRIEDFYESHTLDLASAAGRLRAVNMSNIRNFPPRYPDASVPFSFPRTYRMFGEAAPNFEALVMEHRGEPFVPIRPGG